LETVVVTGSSGLIGSEAVRYFSSCGMRVVGVDNDLRSHLFGEGASTKWNRDRLLAECPGFLHRDWDIRSEQDMGRLFGEFGADIRLVIHAAAQPSHDWAAKDPFTDFSINANGTLVLLEAVRKHCPEAVFIYLSTNKVYGDRPNKLPLVEKETRYELDPAHPFHSRGIDESMSIDDCTHSLFGVSKASADLLVQEYGRYFGMKTACFRGGCLTGPSHSGTELHGFLSYLMICAMKKQPYTVFGYQGKQVRDNIHSHDLVSALNQFYRRPGVARVYNIGGGRRSNCSLLEAIALAEKITGNRLDWKYDATNRIGDHLWWISDTSRFEKDYPDWSLTRGVEEIMEEIHQALKVRMG